MSEDQTDETARAAASEAPEAAEVPPQYGVGPFSIREVAILGVWVVAFVVSFFSVSEIRFASVWTSGLLWILTIGVPTAAVGLLVLRRLSPSGIRRVGSLGIDQFASVAFAVSAMLWVQFAWETVSIAVTTGIWARGWVMWVELVLMLGGVVLTVFAPIIPVLGEDFRHRPEVPAHRSARPLRPVSARPAPASPAPVDVPVVHDAGETAPSGEVPVAASAPEEARPEPADASQPVSYEAFWALAPVEREVVDETGAPLFLIGPTAWALVIEDRGSLYVVRHEDGRVGYLHDTSGVTRG